MGLVQGQFLLALIGLAIPLALHLSFRSRPLLVELGSIRFLREVVERSRNRRRLMHWLLLSLRLAFVGLLAFLFARPYFPKEGGADNHNLVVVLIDASQSMQLTLNGEPRFDRAKTIAHELAVASPKESLIRLASFGNQVAAVELDEIDELECSREIGNMAAALRWANDVCAQTTAPRQVIHLITDLQQSGLGWSESSDIVLQAPLQVHDVGNPNANNLAVVSATPQRTTIRPGERTSIYVELANYGPFLLTSAPVVLTLQNGTRSVRLEQHIDLQSGASLPVTFDTPELAAGIWTGTVSVEAIDDLGSDNVRHVAIVAAPPLEVLLIDDPPTDERVLPAAYFIDFAVRLSSGDRRQQGPYTTRRVTAEQLTPALLREPAVVVLPGMANVSREAALAMKQFVQQGGGLLIFGGGRLTPESCREIAKAGLLPGKIGPFRHATDLPFRLSSFDLKSKMFAPFLDPQHGDLRQIAFAGYTPITPMADATVLACLGDDVPLLVERKLGAGQTIYSSVACDLQGGDWVRTPLFVPMVHQMLNQLVGLENGEQVESVIVDGANEVASSPRSTAGGRTIKVVNLDPSESQTVRCSPEDIYRRFAAVAPPLINEDLMPINTATDVRTFAGRYQHGEYWPLIAAFLICLAAFEYAVGNRVTA